MTNKNIFIFTAIFVTLLIGTTIIAYVLESGQPSLPGRDETALAPAPPEEYSIYQSYLGKILHGYTRTGDEGVIEATVLSIGQEEVCPDEPEEGMPGPNR